MIKLDSHLPDDIAREKDISRGLINEYRNAFFGGMRRFRALRQQAPGIIVESLLGAILSIFGVLSFFAFIHEAKTVGPIPTIIACIKIVVIIGVCYWAAGRIWRAIGLTLRDRCRFVMRNIWSLAGSGFFLLVLGIQIFYPEFANPPKAAPANIPAVAAVPVAASAPVVLPRHEPGKHKLVFGGPGWQILSNDDSTYTRLTVTEASPQCALLGDNWIVADRQDYDDLETELIEGGHVGDFWTASAKPGSNLTYILNPDASSAFYWTSSRANAQRKVLCVMAVSIQ